MVKKAILCWSETSRDIIDTIATKNYDIAFLGFESAPNISYLKTLNPNIKVIGYFDVLVGKGGQGVVPMPTFGDENIEASVAAFAFNESVVCRFQAKGTGTITKLTLRCWGATGTPRVKGVVYADMMIDDDHDHDHVHDHCSLFKTVVFQLKFGLKIMVESCEDSHKSKFTLSNKRRM